MGLKFSDSSPPLPQEEQAGKGETRFLSFSDIGGHSKDVGTRSENYNAYDRKTARQISCVITNLLHPEVDKS